MEANSLLIYFVVVIIVIIAWILIMISVQTVPQAFEYTVERFGKYTRTLQPGLNFINPFFENIAHKINMMENVQDIPPQKIITKDNAIVDVDGVVFFQVVDAPKASYAVNNLNNAIINLTMTNIRTVMGSMELDELLSKRDEINHQLLRVVDEATTPWGIKILRIEIKDIAPPKELVDAMASQLKADRERRASVLRAQGDREAEILRAEGKKQAEILEAEGNKEASFMEAEAREREAEAEAKATAMVSQAISRGNIHAINYFVAQKYMDALGQIASADNQKVIMMPLDASGVIGSIAGISELAKEALKTTPPSRQQNGQLPRRNTPRPVPTMSGNNDDNTTTDES